MLIFVKQKTIRGNPVNLFLFPFVILALSKNPIMRLRFLFSVLLLLVGTISFSQILKPAKWTYDVSAREVKVGDELTLVFHATLDPSWYLYSTEFPCEDGPTKAEFTFK